MQITIDLPDDLFEHTDPAREALEALAIEGYRSEALTHGEAARMLGLNRIDFDGFLKQRNIFDHAYGPQDLIDDIETLKQFEKEDKIHRQSAPAA